MSYNNQNNLGANIDPTYSKTNNDHNPLTSNTTHGSAGQHSHAASALNAGVNAVTGTQAAGGHIGTNTGSGLTGGHPSGGHGLTGTHNTHGLAGSNVTGNHGLTGNNVTGTHGVTGTHATGTHGLTGNNVTGTHGVTGTHTTGTHGLTGTHGVTGTHATGTHGVTGTHTGTHIGPNGEEIKPSKIGGKIDEIKGNMKESIGKTFNKPEMVASGIQDQHIGEAKQAAAAAAKKH